MSEDGQVSKPRPAESVAQTVLFVAAGGALGTAVRVALGRIIASGTVGFPTATFLVNLVGSLVVGVAITSTSEHRPSSLRIRLFLATGVCGGMTTFSSFATQFDLLWHAGRVGVAVGYALATRAGGLLACRVGVFLARPHGQAKESA